MFLMVFLRSYLIHDCIQMQSLSFGVIKALFRHAVCNIAAFISLSMAAFCHSNVETLEL